MVSLTEIKEKLHSFNSLKLCDLPTPFERMKNLSSWYKGLDIYIKRDDQTGLAMGGNKARKLEFIMADVLQKSSKSVVTWGGFHSNWCRQVAAATNQFNVKPVLILLKKPNTKEEYDGNVLINTILNADIRITPVKKDQKMFELKDMQNIINPILEEEEEKGNKPYLAPLGGSLIEGSMTHPLGALSYLQAFIEIIEQASLRNVSIDSIILATGSASTQAGLLAGAKIIAPEIKIIGISVSEDKQTMNRYIKTIANKTFVDLGFNLETKPEDIIVFDEYIEEGYGVLTKKVADKIRLMATTEGILLDPVYTGKALAGLDDLIKKDYFKKQTNIVFLHSGGTPSLFPYREQLVKFFS